MKAVGTGREAGDFTTSGDMAPLVGQRADEGGRRGPRGGRLYYY